MKNKDRQKEYSRKHYDNNKEHKISQVRENNKNYKLRNRQYTYDYLKENPCVGCGEHNPIVLQFDHNDPSQKISTVAKLSNSSGSLKRLKEEISKCTVRCANCHSIKTAKDNDWYKNLV